jgi:hypothetical protein
MGAEQATRLSLDGFALREATRDDIPVMAALHRAEPVHWVRPPRTWQRAFDCHFVMNRLSEFFLIENDGDVWGYFIMAIPGPRDRSPWVSEFAGDRRLLLAAFGEAMRQRNVGAVRWHVGAWDTFGLCVAKDAGLESHPSHTSGTHLIVNFPQFGERMRPYLSEFIGSETADALRFTSDGDACTVSLDGETFVLPNRGCAAHFLFGTREERPTPPPSDGRLAEVYAKAFPIPALWYGINYI